jgi:hypothetical protein
MMDFSWLGRVWRMSVKPSASPTQVRTLDLPPPAKRPPNQHICGQGVVSSYAAACGVRRSRAGSCAEYVPKSVRA